MNTLLNYVKLIIIIFYCARFFYVVFIYCTYTVIYCVILSLDKVYKYILRLKTN